MACNVGKLDKTIRSVVGIAMIIWAVLSGNMLGYMGIIFILTAVFNFCPMYKILGISTSCELKEKEIEV